MKRFVVPILLGLFFSLRSSGQVPFTAKLDSLLNSLASRDLAMGSLTVSRNGAILYQRAIGNSFIDNGNKIAANVDTKYRIGSISKMFTAVIIFQLIEEGKINIDQKLDSFFPHLPNANKIAIGTLLNHRSGLHDYTKGTNFQEWMNKPKTQDEILKIITEKGADFEPNSRTEYNNTNYLLLSYIIEKACEMPYDSVLKKRIASKIGLSNTYYGNPIDIKKNESTSYKYVEGNWKKERETDMSIHVGAGSIVSTPTDLVKFIEALFDCKLVNKSSLNRMKTIAAGFGMGMFPFDHGSKTGYGHNGRIEEFYSSLRYYPDEKLSFAYCTNGIVYPRVDLFEGVLKICFNEPFIVPFSKRISFKSEDLDKYLGKYSSSDPPIIVSCTKNNTKLLVEVKGNIFEVEPIADGYFMHAPSGSFFEFNPEKGELQIKETDNVYYLTREK